tara:strand:- start:929 stop:1324 length:396 start_codon:yes stop_codon:yes gene_type:complete
MALGSANTAAQARGKNKSVKLKRYKEVKLAKGGGSFVGSANLGTAKSANKTACSTSVLDVNITYYHNGSLGVPAVGDKIYAKRRYNDKYLAADGFYKVRANTPIGPGPYPAPRYYKLRMVNGLAVSVNICP